MKSFEFLGDRPDLDEILRVRACSAACEREREEGGEGAG